MVHAQSIDTDHSGTITVEELKVGLRKQGSTVTEAELADLVRNLDADNSGTIDYEVRGQDGAPKPTPGLNPRPHPYN